LRRPTLDQSCSAIEEEDEDSKNINFELIRRNHLMPYRGIKTVVFKILRNPGSPWSKHSSLTFSQAIDIVTIEIYLLT
jgi:hypothetical protein